MNYIDEILTTLLLLGPDDLENAKRYLKWIKIRRMVNNRFYFMAHWIGSRGRYHWIGDHGNS